MKIIAANWKMNGSLASVEALIKAILRAEKIHAFKNEVIVFPPSLYLPLVQKLLMTSKILIGAQNCYPKNQGAITGEVATPMLKEFGCQYVLIGHSERRQLFNEDEKFIVEKFHHVKEHDMIPILCVGETWEQKNQGLTKEVIFEQLKAIFKENTLSFDKAIVAYEPVWAIGTNQSAKAEQIEAVHAMIKEFIENKIPVLYGGSVNEKNAPLLLNSDKIDGLLIGNASLDAQKFVEIIKCIN